MPSTPNCIALSSIILDPTPSLPSCNSATSGKWKDIPIIYKPIKTIHSIREILSTEAARRLYSHIKPVHLVFDENQHAHGIAVEAHHPFFTFGDFFLPTLLYLLQNKGQPAPKKVKKKYLENFSEELAKNIAADDQTIASLPLINTYLKALKVCLEEKPELIRKLKDQMISIICLDNLCEEDDEHLNNIGFVLTLDPNVPSENFKDCRISDVNVVRIDFGQSFYKSLVSHFPAYTRFHQLSHAREKFHITGHFITDIIKPHYIPGFSLLHKTENFTKTGIAYTNNPGKIKANQNGIMQYFLYENKENTNAIWNKAYEDFYNFDTQAFRKELKGFSPDGLQANGIHIAEPEHFNVVNATRDIINIIRGNGRSIAKSENCDFVSQIANIISDKKLKVTHSIASKADALNHDVTTQQGNITSIETPSTTLSFEEFQKAVKDIAKADRTLKDKKREILYLTKQYANQLSTVEAFQALKEQFIYHNLDDSVIQAVQHPYWISRLLNSPLSHEKTSSYASLCNMLLSTLLRLQQQGEPVHPEHFYKLIHFRTLFMPYSKHPLTLHERLQIYHHIAICDEGSANEQATPYGKINFILKRAVKLPELSLILPVECLHALNQKIYIATHRRDLGSSKHSALYILFMFFYILEQIFRFITNLATSLVRCVTAPLLSSQEKQNTLVHHQAHWRPVVEAIPIPRILFPIFAWVVILQHLTQKIFSNNQPKSDPLPTEIASLFAHQPTETEKEKTQNSHIP